MTIPWQSLLDEPRAPGATGPGRRDWLVLGAVLLGATLEAAFRTDLAMPVLCWLVTVGLSPSLLFRRTHPLVVLVVAFATSTVVDVGLLLTDRPTLEMVSAVWFVLLPYALLRWGSGREVATGLAVVLVAAALGVMRGGLDEAIGGMTVLLTAMALGVAVRSQHAVRHRRLEQVKADERVQLARELHDTVAHHVSAIAIQAQAGRALAATSPESSVRALEVIEQEASRTLAEMRAMVGVLRNQAPADYTPQHGAADLDRLASASAGGPAVRVSSSGDVDGLPTAVGAAVFRIAQEAVTNARRHARNATTVDVRLDAGDSGVRLVVRDDGDPPTTTGRGFGITGMVERAQLLGGACRVGPGAERGWTVEATLPIEAPR